MFLLKKALGRENAPGEVLLCAVQADQVHPLIASLQHAVRTNGQCTEDVPAKEYYLAIFGEEDGLWFTP